MNWVNFHWIAVRSWWELSGPAILRVSAWGARQLQEMDYHFKISVNWCGNLQEINFKAMENRLIEKLYCAGEVLDIDGITGGFNFQAA